VKVRDVQCDELWGYIGMKEKSKGIAYQGVDTLGDAYCFVAIERHSKMILSWHLGRRTAKDTLAFIMKLRNATQGRFQISTDGWTAYPEAIERVFGIDVDFAQYGKVYAAASEEEGRYSPAKVVDAVIIPKIGMPDYDRICTSHIERQNLTIRMQMRRMTRLTNGFSKKWANLKASFALHFAFCNFCRIHKSRTLPFFSLVQCPKCVRDQSQTSVPSLLATILSGRARRCPSFTPIVPCPGRLLRGFQPRLAGVLRNQQVRLR